MASLWNPLTPHLFSAAAAANLWMLRADAASSCGPADPTLPCRLVRLQGALNVLAILLGGILVLALWFAVRFWRRQRAQDRREQQFRGKDRVIR